ncbi:MAG: hypothetical protein K2X38_12330 [Gemmataceae bacterium]|nr:hypothetical protein [Gemmataceae bacterium]
MPQTTTQIDAIEELKLRRWARENYVPDTQRTHSWHPVVLDEMRRKDSERETTFAVSQS